ncbi:hypothetical protein [Oleiagrimonas sp. MCCC 1A03011]|uniref:tetratricopeptide repeat protein n=1 Tax=Oleiagrimonas sp. MCCC 1A03011 TaxID=1926883 RepID=UPI000DC52157|nr:hypothetical protein [Oleiagrimonas sp. MCCC 1A03011]RAP59376.1 hypothetical protein BTJ49_01545 [Oleiagrimonas sp. MCCC 1A03011]
MKYQLPALIVALLVTALLYWPSLHGPFLFDDLPNLSALSSITHIENWRDLGIYLSQPRNFPGRPLAMLSFLLQKSSWPGHSFPFHLVNLGIHLLCGVLVYLLVLRVARAWLGRDSTHEPQIWIPATLATAIWLINPIQLAGVLLVVQRMTLLMAVFVLLGLHAYMRGLLNEALSSRQRGGWMILGLGVCLVPACLSKENGILLPLYALVLDTTVLREYVQRLPGVLKWCRRILIWPILAFVLAYLVWMIPKQWDLASIRPFSIGERLLTEPRIVLDYLGKIFLPRFGIYGLYHDGYRFSTGLLTPWSTLPSLVVVAGLTVAAFVRRKRWPLFALAVFWYLGGQLLESSSIMLELYFEHRNYLPLAGIVLALALAVARMQPDARRSLAMGLASLWLIACGITTALSAHVYASPDRLALTWANAQPDSIRAQTYLADRLLKHGQLEQALKVINTATKRHPHDSMLAENRAYLQCRMGTLTPEDVNRLDATLKVAPFDRGGVDNMETLRKLAFEGRCPAMNPKNWLRLTNTLLSNPAYARYGIAAGFLHYQKHFWAVSKGKLDMAIHELDLTYKADPDAEIPRLQAKYLISAGLYDQAIATLRDTNYKHLPLLRRLLVDDRAINAKNIRQIEAMKHKALTDPGDTIKATPAVSTNKSPSGK